MSEKKIPLPEKSFCGLTFRTKNWWKHFSKCEFCKNEYDLYSKKMEIERNNNWKKYCECGCGLIAKYGKKRIIGHGSIGCIRTEEQKQNYRNSFTEMRRTEMSHRNKINNPMFRAEIREKVKNTCLKKYGVENVSYSQSVKDKISKNNSMKNFDIIKKHKLAVNRPDVKEKTSVYFRNNNPAKNKEFLEKRIDTYTRNLASGKYAIKNNWKTGYYTRKNGEKEWYDSSFELKRMQHYDSLDIKWTKKHKIRIPYINSDGLNTYYVPDFFIDSNVIEEIKGWVKDDDKLKAYAAINFCKKNGYKYRFFYGPSAECLSLVEGLSYDK